MAQTIRAILLASAIAISIFGLRSLAWRFANRIFLTIEHWKAWAFQSDCLSAEAVRQSPVPASTFGVSPFAAPLCQAIKLQYHTHSQGSCPLLYFSSNSQVGEIGR